MPIRSRAGGVVALAAITVLTGCGSSAAPDTSVPAATGTAASSSPAADASPTSSEALAGAMTVMAPGPLKAALDKAKAAFEAANPQVTVTMNYAHIPTLLSQLSEGVSADVLLTPDEGTMKMAQGKELTTGTPEPVATNVLALVVPADNPGKVTGVADLGKKALTIAVCAAELPCGKLTDALAKKADVTIEADSLEPGGSPGVVTKVATGEVDLGVVFAPDIKTGGDKVTAIPIDAAVVTTSQVLAVELGASTDPTLAQAFLDFLTTPEGAALFTGVGFGPL